LSQSLSRTHVNHFARLITLKNNQEDQRVFEFLINPEAKRFSRKANYSPAITASTSTPAQNYLYTEGRTLTLNSLLMDTYLYKKSLRSAIESLESLLVADTQNKQWHPKVVYFVWGTEKFGPCVLTDLSWEESSWLGGEPAIIRLDMTLLQVPNPDNQPKEVSPVINPNLVALGSSSTATTSLVPINLTDRQKAEASKKAEKFLRANLTKVITPELKQKVQSNQYKWKTESDGKVYFVSPNASDLLVGVWNGTAFDTSAGTLISN
jgi:hypothetical protein